MEIERRSTRFRYVENSVWKRLWTCREKDWLMVVVVVVVALSSLSISVPQTTPCWCHLPTIIRRYLIKDTRVQTLKSYRGRDIGCTDFIPAARYSLTPCSRVQLGKLTGSRPVKKLSALYGTRRFIPALTSPCHLSLSWASSIQSITPHPTSWRSILILPAHLLLGLPSVLSFPQVSPPKPCIHLSSPLYVLHTPTHHILLDFITRTIFGEQYRSLSSSLCSFLHFPVTSSS